MGNGPLAWVAREEDKPPGGRWRDALENTWEVPGRRCRGAPFDHELNGGSARGIMILTHRRSQRRGLLMLHDVACGAWRSLRWRVKLENGVIWRLSGCVDVPICQVQAIPDTGRYGPKDWALMLWSFFHFGTICCATVWLKSGFISLRAYSDFSPVGPSPLEINMACSHH